jgi:hypothetical protein
MALKQDFALEGFRLIREKPQLILYWWLLSLIKVLISYAVLSTMAGPEFMAYVQLSQSLMQKPDNAQIMAQLQNLLLALIPVLAAFFLISVIFETIISTAVLRAVKARYADSFGSDSLGYLRLGIDEVRQLASLLAVVLALAPLGFSLLLVVGILSSLSGFSLMSGLGQTLAFIVMFMVGFYLLVRLSLVFALAFDQVKIDLIQAFRLTRSKVKSLLGGFALALVLIYLINILVMLPFSAFLSLVEGLELKAMFSLLAPDFTDLNRLFSTASFFYMLAISVSAPLGCAVWVGACACAYRQLKPV